MVTRMIGAVPAVDVHQDLRTAVRDLCKAFKARKLPNSFDDDIYFNVKRMKRLGIK